MKQRFRYALLFGLGGIFVSFVVFIVVTVVSMSLLWILVFGDSGPEPFTPGMYIGIAAGVIFEFASIIFGYIYGQKKEKTKSQSIVNPASATDING